MIDERAIRFDGLLPYTTLQMVTGLTSFPLNSIIITITATDAASGKRQLQIFLSAIHCGNLMSPGMMSIPMVVITTTGGRISLSVCLSLSVAVIVIIIELMTIAEDPTLPSQGMMFLSARL